MSFPSYTNHTRKLLGPESIKLWGAGQEMHSGLLTSFTIKGLKLNSLSFIWEQTAG